MNTNQYYLKFVDIINRNPNLVKLFLLNYGIQPVGNPTVEHIKQANDPILIRKIFEIELDVNASYASGFDWLSTINIAVPAVTGILGIVLGNDKNSSTQETAAQIEARLKAEAKAKEEEEKKKKQQTYILIGGAILVIGAIAFFLLKKPLNP